MTHLSYIVCPFFVQRIHEDIYLWNNYARFAGNTLYGGSNVCFDSVYSFYNISNISKNGISSLSNIASDPYEICFCRNGDVQCEISTVEITAYPGQMFNISAVTVGHYDGVVPSAIQAHLGPNSSYNGRFSK